MKKLLVVDDDSTLSATEFFAKFKSPDGNFERLDIFESSDEEIPEVESSTSFDQPAYRPIASVNDVITRPPKDHSELVNCFRERLHLENLRYTSVDEQKELADVLMMAIVTLWPQHRRQAANPFLSESGNRELKRRVAVYVIEAAEKLFYDYVAKAEEWNSKLVFSSQANLSRLKTQILHEANRSLNVLKIRRIIGEGMHIGVWLKHPDKGYVKTLINVLDEWNKDITECNSHVYVRRQIKELKTALPDLSNHHMRAHLDSLVRHVEEVMTYRKERDEALGSIQYEESRVKQQESLKHVLSEVKEIVEDMDEALNPRVVYKRCDSMSKLYDGLHLHEGFEEFKGEALKTRRLSVSQELVNSVINNTKTKTEILSPREDLQQLVARKHQNEEYADDTSDDDISPLLQAQNERKKRPRKKIAKIKTEEIAKEDPKTSNSLPKYEDLNQPPSLNIKIPGKNIVRLCDVRVSNRTNTSVLTLNMHPTIYNEFLNEVDTDTVNTLDHHLYASKEIEDVYKEITKTFTKDFLLFDQDRDIEKCPESCKDVSQLFMSGLLQDTKNKRFLNTDLHSDCLSTPWKKYTDASEWRNEPKYAGIGREDMLRINNKAELQRNSFMNIPELGGAGQLAKNYVSWLTWYRNNVDLDDFRKFISNQETDYLCQMHHLYDSDDGDEELDEAARTSAHMVMLREREKIRQQLIVKKNEYEKGFWNVQCINLGGLGKEPSVSLIQQDNKENISHNPDKQSTFVCLQDRLEIIWQSLKMPDAQRLDMAIKHSADPSLEKLAQVVEVWGNVSELIVERENLIAKLESFERSASDPNRFFEKGAKGSSVVRLNESKVREKLHRKIKSQEEEILPLLNYIKKNYNDDVTYHGRNYLMKMQCDQTEMLYWLQQERRKEDRLESIFTKSKLVPVPCIELAADAIK